LPNPCLEEEEEEEEENISIFIPRVFVWVWNLVCHTEGRTWIEEVWVQGPEENIWTQVGGSGGRLKKTA
jgi:hypothetical protein